MLRFKDLKRNIAIFIKAKEDLICKSAFPKSYISLDQERIITPEIPHKSITKVEVTYVLIFQLVKKALILPNYL